MKYFMIYIFSSKVKKFYYMNFSFNTFLVSTFDLAFVFTQVRILLSVYNWPAARGCKKPAMKDIRILCNKT